VSFVTVKSVGVTLIPTEVIGVIARLMCDFGDTLLLALNASTYFLTEAIGGGRTVLLLIVAPIDAVLFAIYFGWVPWPKLRM